MCLSTWGHIYTKDKEGFVLYASKIFKSDLKLTVLSQFEHNNESQED
jgi:hypothetical protein